MNQKKDPPYCASIFYLKFQKGLNKKNEGTVRQTLFFKSIMVGIFYILL